MPRLPANVAQRVLRVVCRAPSLARCADGSDVYKKGWEVRLVVASTADAELVRAWLARHDVEAGRTFAHRNQAIVPVYGYDRMTRLAAVLPRPALRDALAEWEGTEITDQRSRLVRGSAAS